jgi:uncharacterized protein (DUF305 family)
MSYFSTKKLLQLASIGSMLILTACSQTVSSQSKNVENVSNKQHHGNMGGHHNMSMDLGDADAQYDLRFIDSMIPHHQGAVEMAKDILNKTKRPEIKQLAESIITAQDKEINQMKQWRESWYPNAGETAMMWHAGMKHSMPMTEEHRQNMMMSTDLGDADEEVDLRFIDAMIPHHEGALTMAKDALNKTKRPELKQLAESILSSQQKEIDEMKQWRKDWYGK